MYTPNATAIKDDAEFLACLHGDAKSEAYGGDLDFGEIGTADFVRWLTLAERAQGADEHPISHLDIESAMRLFAEWVKREDVLPLVDPDIMR